MSSLPDESLAVFRKYLLEDGTINDLAYKFYSKLNSIENVGYKDLTSNVTLAGIPAANAPIRRPFGTSGLYEAYDFGINDYVFLEPFHVNHDIKPGGYAFPHVHWSTNGTNIRPVRWEMHLHRALGHNQANFGAPVIYTLTQAPHGTAWRHMITEVGNESTLTLLEPDELIMCVLKRVSNGGVENTDQVFGLTVDLHYQSDRDYTPNKAPNFYS